MSFTDDAAVGGEGLEDSTAVGSDANLAPIPDEVAALEANTEGEGSADQPKTYTVKIDGQDVEVSESELLSGYQRQSDYTRKTQALATERSRFDAYARLEQALEADPEAVLRALADQYNVGLDATGGTEADEWDMDDPLQREVAELRKFKGDVESRFAQQEAGQRQAAVDAEVEQVRTKYKVESDPDFAYNLLSYAVEHQIGNLDSAYRLMAQEAQEQGASQADQEALEAKRSIPPVAGGSANSPSGTSPGPRKKMSFMDAYKAAKNQLPA